MGSFMLSMDIFSSFFFAADFLFMRFPNIFILNFTAAKYFNEYLSGLISKVLDLKQ